MRFDSSAKSYGHITRITIEIINVYCLVGPGYIICCNMLMTRNLLYGQPRLSRAQQLFLSEFARRSFVLPIQYLLMIGFHIGLLFASQLDEYTTDIITRSLSPSKPSLSSFTTQPSQRLFFSVSTWDCNHGHAHVE